MEHSDHSYYHGKTILITGGTGYIGQSIAHALKHVDCTIKRLTRSTGDITDPDIWNKHLADVDIIFHLAGQTSATYANEHPQKDIEVNVLPVVRLIESVQKLNKTPDIIFAATSTQVGVTTETPTHEDTPDRPITIYDINKLAAEKYLLYYANVLHGRAVSLRLTNVYGPGQATGKADRGILNRMVNQALRGQDLTVYGEGNYIRDYVYIDDVVQAFLQAGTHIATLTGNYYLIGSGVGHTIRDMMELITKQVASKTGTQVSVTSIAPPTALSPIESRNFVADTTAFQSKTDWRAQVYLTEGIDKTIDYLISQQS